VEAFTPNCTSRIDLHKLEGWVLHFYPVVCARCGCSTGPDMKFATCHQPQFFRSGPPRSRRSPCRSVSSLTSESCCCRAFILTFASIPGKPRHQRRTNAIFYWEEKKSDCGLRLERNPAAWEMLCREFPCATAACAQSHFIPAMRRRRR